MVRRACEGASAGKSNSWTQFKTDAKRSYLRTVVSIFVTTMIPVVRASFDTFNCIAVADTSVLYSYPTIECSLDNSDYFTLRYVSIPAKRWC